MVITYWYFLLTNVNLRNVHVVLFSEFTRHENMIEKLSSIITSCESVWQNFPSTFMHVNTNYARSLNGACDAFQVQNLVLTIKKNMDVLMTTSRGLNEQLFAQIFWAKSEQIRVFLSNIWVLMRKFATHFHSQQKCVFGTNMKRYEKFMYLQIKTI